MAKFNFRLGKFFTFEWKIRWIIVAFLVGILQILLTSKSNFETIAVENERIIDKYSRAVSRTERLRYMEADETAFAQLYVLTGKPAYLKKVDEKRTAFRQLVEQLKEVLINPTDIEILNAVVKSKVTHDEIADLGLKMRQSGMSLRQIHLFLAKATRVPTDIEFGRLDAFALHMVDELQLAKNEVSNATKRLIHSFVVSSIVMLFAFALLTLIVMRVLNQNAKTEAEKARLFEHAKQMARARKEAVEVVSHDLQNPLAALLLRMQMLMRKANAAKDGHLDIKTDVDRVLHAANHMKDLIRNLLDQAKIDAGGLSLDLSTSDLASVLHDTREIFLPLAREKSIELVLNIDRNLPLFDFDPQYIQQAVSNLLGNALKFSKPGGKIEIGAAQIGTQAKLWVRDNGPGIAKENIPFIFDRYWQSKNTAKLGTGLGLSIVKGIVDAHNGTVSVECGAIGGTCIQISLPIRKPQVKWSGVSPVGNVNR